jgi:uncharacterized cupredoxin-like copper-binding protein
MVAAALAAAPGTDAASSASVRLSDFKVTPSRTSVAHGRVTFRVRNVAGMEHELVVIRTSRRAARLPTSSSGEASEKGAVGEVELDGRRSKSLTLNLKKGHYALICNIAGHYEAGMHADLTVR